MFNPSQAALDAVRAAKNLNRWGPYATARFVGKRGIDKMFIIALRYETNK